MIIGLIKLNSVNDNAWITFPQKKKDNAWITHIFSLMFYEEHLCSLMWK